MFVPVFNQAIMAHHEAHDDHGHDNTEGNRQYYPQGWFIPLIGLVAVALVFSLGAGALLGISGTDKWGKTEQCSDEHCKGDCGHHGDEGHGHDAETHGHGDAEHHGDPKPGHEDAHSGQSNIVPTDSMDVKVAGDSAAHSEADGHGH